MVNKGTPALEVRDLSKSFGPVRAVADLNLAVHPGEIYGFLGLNGAGKTTSIRMMLGLAHPDSGEVRLFGRRLSAGASAGLAGVGSLVETATAWPNLTVFENLAMHRRLIDAPAQAVAEVVALLGLAEYSQRLAGTLSLGNKQRLALARALLGEPGLLILDEPVNGLDPAGIAEIRSLLRRLASERGVAILMSSHLLGEVDQLADRVGVIHRGKLIDEFARGALAERAGPGIELEVDEPGRAEAALRALWPQAAFEARSAGWRVRGPGVEPAAAARALVGAGVGLTRLTLLETDLESFFLGLTGGEA